MDEKDCEECIKFRNDVSKLDTNKIDINKNKIVKGFGNYNSKTLIIGKGPGSKGAAVTGIPFTGDDSGRIVQKALVELELSDNESNSISIYKNFIPTRDSLKCFLTNVFRCYNYKRIKKSDERLKKYNEHCLEHLKDEINKLDNLEKIAVVGKSTKDCIEEAYLEELKNKYDLVCTYHPSYYKHFYYENHKHLSEKSCISRFIKEFNKN